MSAADLNRAEVLRDACIVTSSNLDRHPSLVNEFVLVRYVLAKLLGREIHLVTWPSGISAIVVAEPGSSGWDDLLIKSYAACVDNHAGPVFGD